MPDILASFTFGLAFDPTYTAQGESAYRETWSMPGQELYVILPDQTSVEQAAALLEETLAA